MHQQHFEAILIDGDQIIPHSWPWRPSEPRRYLAAAETGAAIVHLHARNPVDGRPDQTPEAFEPFLKTIKQASNVVVSESSQRSRKIIAIPAVSIP